MVLKDYLQKKRIINIFSLFLAILGALWLILEISSYFIPKICSQYIVSLGVWFLAILILVALVISVFINRPINSINEKLNNRDITITIVIGDFFEQKGDYIVGTNTTFDTNLTEGIIFKNSIQGQFSTKYFEGKIELLDELIEKQLELENDFTIDSNKTGKRNRYPIGKTIQIKYNDVTAYFLALAEMNKYGVASSSYENILLSLSNLWDYISSHGSTDPLVIPILGTGFSRIEIEKEIIIQEIVKSFIAACSEKRFTNNLIIVIYPKDYEDAELDLNKLHEFLKCQCKYAEFKRNLNDRSGTGIEK